MGISAGIGWLLVGFPSGMLTILGAFTSLYVPNRPYANRAIALAAVGVAITLMVGAGMELRPFGWASAALVVLASAVITFLANASRIGPPGAYLVVLAGAAGTSLPAKAAPGQVEILVAIGGAVAWIVHMAGAFREPRGPERRAVLAAAVAIGNAIRAADTVKVSQYRRAAATALHEAWAALTTFQPFELSRGRRLNSLRAINHQLHTIFAEQVLSGDYSRAGASLERIRELAAAARSREPLDLPVSKRLPLGRLELWESLRDNLDRRSPAMRSAILVFIASGIAAALSLLLHLERPYWSIAAAVLVLHQGLSWAGVRRKAADRVVGTAVGLVLAGAILLVRLPSYGVVLSMMVLQFISELLVVRRYAIAVIFITATALLIASGGEPNADVGALVWGRGIDTFLGCATALLVHALIGRRDPDESVALETERVEDAIDNVQEFVRSKSVTALPARRARRDLQHRLLTLASAQERLAQSSRSSRQGDRRLLADIERLENRGYAVLGECWSIELSDSAISLSAR